jgi:hypothetical protein
LGPLVDCCEVSSTVRTYIQALLQARYICKTFFPLELASKRVVRTVKGEGKWSERLSIYPYKAKDRIISNKK